MSGQDQHEADSTPTQTASEPRADAPGAAEASVRESPPSGHEAAAAVSTQGEELAEDALVKRKVRRTAKTEIDPNAVFPTAEAAPAEAGAASPEGELHARRPRIRRASTPTRTGSDGEDAPPRAGAPGADRSAPRGERRPERPLGGARGPRTAGRGPGRQGPRDGSPRERRPFERSADRAPAARMGGRPERGPRPPAGSEGAPPAARREGGRAPGAERSGSPVSRTTDHQQPAQVVRGARPAAQPAPKTASKGEDKVTLILHPQPKAAPGRFKKTARPLTAKEALQAKAARRGAGPKPGVGVEGVGAAPAGLPAELRQEWLAASSVDALRSVREAGGQAEALVAAWQQHANVDALVAVAWGSGAAPEVASPVRKSARRAINVLRSRGVTVPDAPAQAAPPVTLGARVEAEAEAPQASFVPPDANGMVFFSITQRLAGGRYRVADVVLRDGVGIMHASSGRLAGKQIRRWRARVESRLGAAPVDVPVEWARHRVARARAENAVSRQVLPLALDGCEPLLAPWPAEAPAHPVADLEATVDEALVSAARAGSSTLHNEPEFRSWLPDRPAIDGMLRQVGTRLGPAGGTEQATVDRTLDEELAEATDRFFTPDVRQRLADRMRDSAISVRRRAGDEAARRVLAVARAVRDAGIVTSPPKELPFLVSFFRKAVAVLARQGEGRLQIPVPAAGAAAGDQAAAPPAGALDEPVLDGDDDAEGR